MEANSVDSDGISFPDDSIKNSNPNMNHADYMVAFSGNTENYCVGLVDMVNSTKIAATIGNKKIGQYYQIFLNSMSKILSRFGGFVIKNVGDCLVYYFPESSKSNRKFGFMSCIECGLAMTEYHDKICEKLNQEGLPSVDYRISADYGSVVLMKSNNSDSMDMIGPPVNMCSKINHAASINNSVIGGDLYLMVKGFNDYRFKEVKDVSLGFKHPYPVYEVHRSWFCEKHADLNNFVESGWILQQIYNNKRSSLSKIKR